MDSDFQDDLLQSYSETELIPYHVKIGPHVIDKSPPIKSTEFDCRAQKYEAFNFIAN